MKIKLYSVALLFLFIGLFSNCIKEDAEPVKQPAGKRAFVFNINIGEHGVRQATEAGEDLFNENKIEKLWLFANKKNQANLFIGASCEPIEGNRYRVAITAEQEQQLNGDVLDIYLVANHDFSTGVKPETVEALKGYLLENKNLNKVQLQSFVMLGVTQKAVNTAHPESKDLGQISLKRILSKIRFNMPVLDLTGYELEGEPEAKLCNFRTQGYLDKAENAGSLINMEQYSPLNELYGNKKCKRYYSFYSEWSNTNENEAPYIMLAINLKRTGENQAVKKYYYRVPVKASEARLKNNVLYDLSVTIETLGGPGPDFPVTVQSSEVSIKEWSTYPDVNSDISSPKYLLVEENNVIMSVVDNYRVGYKSSSLVTPRITKCYYQYVNEDGQVVQDNIPSDNEYYPVLSTSDTHISFTAKIQTNNVPKHFTIELKNSEGLKDNVHVIQYPGQYIAYTFGEKSSWRPDGTLAPGLNNKAVYHIVILIPPKDGEMILGFPETETRSFYSKSGSYNYYKEMDDDHITSDSEETKKTVSPSFELASQLGATIRMKLYENWSGTDYLRYYGPDNYDIQRSYAMHVCASYTETRIVNGKEQTLDDWRLPTEAEIRLIDELQHNGSVKAIMTGKWYWSASGAVKLKQGEGNSSSTSAHTRCVRDVKEYEF